MKTTKKAKATPKAAPKAKTTPKVTDTTKAAAPQTPPPAVDSDMKVKVGDAARAGTFREQIQAHAKQPVTIAHLVEALPKIKNMRAKIRSMLAYGTLVVVKQ
jgi:hypothetical protein